MAQHGMADEIEGTNVQDATVHVAWRTFNIPSIVATVVTVLGTGWAVANYISNLETRVEAIEAFRVSRTETTDQRFTELQQSITPLVNIPYRTNVLEQQTTAINLRIDRFTEIITNTLELIRKDVNGLSTKVEVLSNKIDNLTPEKRAALKRSDYAERANSP